MTDRDTKLRQVMKEYRGITTDNLLADTLIRTSGDPDAPMRAAAATLGFTRSAQYMDAARSLMHQIMDEAEEIAWNMEAYERILGELRRHGQRTPTSNIQIKAAVKFNLGGKTLSVHAELLWHFYALSLQHVWHFMLNSLHAIDPIYTPAKDVLDYLEIIRLFRNHMEHRDKATANITSADWLTMSKQDSHSATVGYERDQDNNITFVVTDKKNPLDGTTQKMPVNPKGFERFETMIITVYQQISENCLEGV